MAFREDRLSRWYEQFGRDHDRLRGQLIQSLRKVEKTETTRRKPFLTLRPILAAAAMIAVLMGTMFVNQWTDRPANNPQAAWADTVDHIGRLQSIHLTWQTPQGGKDAAVEMWWQRPHDFRLEFTTGLVWTGDSQKRCSYNPGKNELVINDAQGPSLEMVVLGELGQLFYSSYALSKPADWVNDSQIIESEKIIYKAEACQKIVFDRADRRYEFIIDERAVENQAAPFYQVKVFDGPQKKQLISHMEVLDVDRYAPQEMFTIQPADGCKVIDRRGKTDNKIPTLPKTAP